MRRSILLSGGPALIAVAVMAASTYVFFHTIGFHRVLGFLYLFGIMGAAWWGGYASGALVTLTAFFVLPYLFIPHFDWHSIDFTRLPLVLIVSLLVSHSAARRKRTERELRDANSAIEQRVKERTAELERANAALHNSQQERQKGVEELRRAHEQYATVLESITDGFVALDRQWRYTYINSKAANLLRRPVEQMLGLSLWDVFPNLVGSDFERQVRNTMATRQPLTFDHHDDASKAWFEMTVYPSMGGVTIFSRDITERVNAAKERRELFEQIEAQAALLDMAHDGIMALHLDGTIEFWNRGAERMYGYTAQEAIGRISHDLLQTKFSQPLEEIKRTLLDRGTWEGELIHTRKDGTEIHLLSHWAVRLGDDGRPAGILEITRDLTQRLRLEEQLRQAAKLESLGVLAGGIAHDFNNLLVAIMGNASLALDNTTPVNPNHHLLQDVVAASERAADLTRQLLAYAGKGRFTTQLISLSELVRELGTLLQAAIPKNVQIRFDLAPELPAVEADVGQLQQVIMNLVINGAEAMGTASGAVLVTTGLQEVDRQYLDSLALQHDLSTGSYVTLEVHDTGCGMDEQTIAKIFDPFFTTKFQGRGLGLAAVQGIIRSHKGGLKVYSAPGKGTTFKILLPTTAEAAQPLRGVEGTTSDRLAGTGVVLVVDDEPFVRQTAKNTLDRYGYTVLTASDGAEGLEMFRSHRDRIRLVLLDLTMPVMGGEDALRHMKVIEPNVRVVLSSGFNEIEAIRRFTGKGLAGFIQKPYTASALASKVKEVLARP